MVFISWRLPDDPGGITCMLLYKRKQRSRVAELISAFVVPTYIVQSLYILNPKIQASSHFLWFVSDLVRNSDDWFSRESAQMFHDHVCMTE